TCRPSSFGEIEAAEVEWSLLLAASATGISAEAARSRRSPARVSFRRRRIDVVRIEPKLVVNLPLLRVAQHVVRLGDLFKLLLGLLVSRVHIRMVFAREFAERLADLFRRRILLYSKRAVIIFRLCRHMCS